MTEPVYGLLRSSVVRRAARRQAQFEHFVFVHINKTGGTSIRHALNLGLTPYHLTAREIRERYPESCDKFSFALVRNPWDRLVSFGHSLRIPVDWNEPNKFDRLDLRPQVDFIMDEAGQPMVDFIGRYENLAEDFATICDRIGIPTPPLPHLNASRHRHYRDYYDESAKQFVAEKYAEDIERFGYSF